MPDRSAATRTSVTAALTTLQASPLEAVAYFGFPLGLPSGEPVDSEWGDATEPGANDAKHHEPAMGVELRFEDRSTVTVCWGDAFGHYGLELIEAPALNVFQNDPIRCDVSRHHWWAPLVGRVLSAELHWAAGFADAEEPAPLVLQLMSDRHALWLSAAELRDDGEVLLGMDGVTVSPNLDGPVASVIA